MNVAKITIQNWSLCKAAKNTMFMLPEILHATACSSGEITSWINCVLIDAVHQNSSYLTGWKDENYFEWKGSIQKMISENQIVIKSAVE